MSIAAPVLVLFLSLSITLLRADVKPRVKGGTKCDSKDHPSRVTVINIALLQICGGVIITQLWALTAAKCVPPNENQQTIVIAGLDSLDLGSFSALAKPNISEAEALHLIEHKIKEMISKLQSEPHVQVRDVEKIKINENYQQSEKNESENTRYDIALLKLTKSFEITDNVKPARVPEDRDENCEASPVAMGWEADASGLATGEKMYMFCLKMEVNEEDDRCPYKMLCTSTRKEDDGKMCNSDAGNPLMCKDVVIGILSDVVDCYTNLAFFVDVEDLTSWIEAVGVKGLQYAAGNSCGLHVLVGILCPLLLGLQGWYFSRP